MSGRMTNQEWEAQNGALSPAEATAQGLCWHCSGKGANYTAFGGVQRKVNCPECKGTDEDQR
jgi:DnaJ-class molecular chaperone